jgi:ceramide glucosyltransferase
MDNLHLASLVGAGVVTAKRLGGRTLVIGKSMALWRHDLERLGGFESVKDVLAEDHVLGNRVETELHKRVVISSQPVFNVSVNRSVMDFMRRYARWAVIQRTAVSGPTYLAQALLNPVPLALLGFSLANGQVSPGLLAWIAVAKLLLHVATAMAQGNRFRPVWLVAVWTLDLALFACWVHGLYTREVNWRGNRLRVTHGSLLVPLEPGVARFAA